MGLDNRLRRVEAELVRLSEDGKWIKWIVLSNLAATLVLIGLKEYIFL